MKILHATLLVLCANTSMHLSSMITHESRLGFSCGVFGGVYDGSVNHGHAGTGFFLGVMLPSFVYAEKVMTPPQKVAFFKSALAGYITISMLIIQLAKTT